jgi:hypothetical protein
MGLNNMNLNDFDFGSFYLENTLGFFFLALCYNASLSFASLR